MEERNYDALKLHGQLCFPLYACSREIIKSYTPHLDKIGLTYTQYITMMVLWEHKKMTVKELGTALHLDSGTLTPLLKKLEEKGLVSRKRSTLDERNLIVSITPAGEKLKEAAIEVPYALAKCINLSHEETRMLYNLLNKLLLQMNSAE